jgi:hypothetical protein
MIQIGDLVRHRYEKDIGIVIGTVVRNCNITMGMAKWLVVRWSDGSKRESLPLFLEPLSRTDSFCP